MLHDDGDEVRGLGFVSMYSAWVEEDTDELLRALDSIEPFDEKKQRWPISQKLKHAAALVRKIASAELDGLPEALDSAISLFERRNEVVHGRIYAGHDKKVYLQSGRANVPTKTISSKELYQLANDFWDHRGSLIGPPLFRLPRALATYAKAHP